MTHTYCCGAEITEDELGRFVAKDCICPNPYLDMDLINDS